MRDSEVKLENIRNYSQRDSGQTDVLCSTMILIVNIFLWRFWKHVIYNKLVSMWTVKLFPLFITRKRVVYNNMLILISRTRKSYISCIIHFRFLLSIDNCRVQTMLDIIFMKCDEFKNEHLECMFYIFIFSLAQGW